MSFVRVALDVPLPKLFDYRAPDATDADIGARVVVPFGKKVALGIIVERMVTSELPAAKVRAVLHILREIPPLPTDVMNLLKFCSDYYHYPLGATILNALPTRLRRAQTIKKMPALPNAGSPARSPQMPALMGRSLNAEQTAALERLRAHENSFAPFLLHGVTGSGKTEIYFHRIADMLVQGKQTLLLVPEINLTPQLETLVRQRFPNVPLAILHSGLSEGERLQHWLAAQAGHAGIVLGTRLAIFAPMPALGLVIIDEEHDASFKQMEGLRYSARDVAIVRAQRRSIPIILGSATPSLETLHQVQSKRYRQVELTQRANGLQPVVECINTRDQPLIDGLSQPLIAALHTSIKQGDQSLVFINRRGYAPVLACRSCGWTSDCHRCSAHLVLHAQEHRLHCHHCGHVERVPAACPQCGNQDLAPVGQGTQRVEFALKRLFPTARILRIDRDSTRKKNAWSEMREQIQSGEVDILVGTQILAKGHDFPRLNLVGVLNADGALYSTALRAAEQLYAQLVQVAGRAGRGEQAGRVLIQTEFPDHPLYAALRRNDYMEYAQTLLAERKQAGQPPYTYQAMLRAEATKLVTTLDFLERAARSGQRIIHKEEAGIMIYDAVPATLTRLAGKERAHLIVEATSRGTLQKFLTAWSEPLDTLAERKVRWSLDVDPLES